MEFLGMHMNNLAIATAAIILPHPQVKRRQTLLTCCLCCEQQLPVTLSVGVDQSQIWSNIYTNILMFMISNKNY